MASTAALCRIRVKNYLHTSMGLRTINDCLQITSEMRLQWAKKIANQYCTDTAPDHRYGVRDWDLVLDYDGPVANVAESPSSQPTLSTAVAQKREYPVHYQAPKSIIDRLDSSLERIRRTELFALGSLLYELISSKKPFHDKSEQEIQILYARGDFPDDVWSLQNSISILCCWCPEFAYEVRRIYTYYSLIFSYPSNNLITKTSSPIHISIC
jgi:hypothetical protein